MLFPDTLDGDDEVLSLFAEGSEDGELMILAFFGLYGIGGIGAVVAVAAGDSIRC